MSGLFLIALNAVLIENYVLVRTIGCCPFLGVSRKTDTAMGMGMAVIFTMTLASGITWAVDHLILVPFKLEYMRTVAFILIIATLVQFVEMALKKILPALYSALGIYLPLITTNCAVLGAALDGITEGYNFIESVVFGMMSAVGFALAIVLFSGVRERTAGNDIPKAFEGFPFALVSASLLAMAFTGFSGLSI
ncbi:MAG: RnfABCDGE type electron transport complex subunit A [Clostridia bacterium]|nr:RnfABCDGE type electron transport complex subunit A [Clostridia bacterium]MBQ3076759.1 RnfABCDGE type electron transport complex subunit A [Clostridia bacterium]